jgi:aryl-alcohol dehydrogenase-like predicted oxidoreductase
LKTDYVDVFFLHGYDDQTGEEEILRTLDVLHKEGKFLCIGVSNYASFQVERLLWTAKLEHLVGISAIQPMYNIAKRMAEVELLPMAEKEGLAVMTYSPLGGGLLTGRYGKGKEGSGRLVENPAYSKRYGGPFYEQVATDFSALAQELGMKEATLAVAWVMAQPRVTCPIIGAANDLQLRDSLSALDVVLSEEVKKKIDTISPPLPPAHDRSEVKQ